MPVLPRSFVTAISQTTLCLGLAACANHTTPPPRPAPTPPAAVAVPRVGPAARLFRAPNAEALETSLLARKWTSNVVTNGAGQVSRIDFTKTVPAPQPAAALFLDTMREEGASLGYGELGRADVEGVSGLAGSLESVVGSFPNASDCHGLRFEAAFFERVSPDGTRYASPTKWAFACPESDADMQALRIVHQAIENNLETLRRTGVVPTDDPFAPFVKSEALAVGTFRRHAEGLDVVLRSPKAIVGDRVSVVKAFAERVARIEKLPTLDTVEVTPIPGEPTTPEARRRSPFGTVTLRAARPPLDGVCIDPRVVVQLMASTAPGSAAIHGVSIECKKEPRTGAAPPLEEGQTLPAAAQGSLPYLAICKSQSYSNDSYSGTVIDKRGNVFTFGGKGPGFSGASAHALAVSVREGKSYQKTLEPADVDRLAGLAIKVEREPKKTTASPVNGLPSFQASTFEQCSLLHAGASPDAMVVVHLNEQKSDPKTNATYDIDRVGPAATAALELLGKARNP